MGPRPCFSTFYLMLAIGLLLMACENKNDPEAALDNYLYRLSNSLEVELSEVSKPSVIPRYPSQKELTYSIPAANINLIQFLKLSSCDLQRHIGSRNSSLGQFMPPSQQWIYEQRFLTLAKQCLQQLAKNSELSELLKETIPTKEAQLPLVVWNATFASKEFATLFSVASEPLDLASVGDKPVELQAALNFLTSIVKANGTELKDKELESAYAVIGSSKRVGELRLTIQLLTEKLQQANRLLRIRAEDKPLCYQMQPNKQFTIVQQVFTTFYAGDIQPYVARIYQQTQTVFDEIETLLIYQPEQEVMVGFWAKVYRSTDSEWLTFHHSVEQHIQLWQKLLTQCGAMPG